MGELSEADFATAEAVGTELEAREVRAVSAHYEPETAMIVITLHNDCVFSFPARLGQGLADATDAELAAVRVEGNGYGLHWERLDVDLAVPMLLLGRFGSDRHMSRLGRAA